MDNPQSHSTVQPSSTTLAVANMAVSESGANPAMRVMGSASETRYCFPLARVMFNVSGAIAATCSILSGVLITRLLNSSGSIRQLQPAGALLSSALPQSAQRRERLNSAHARSDKQWRDHLCAICAHVPAGARFR